MLGKGDGVFTADKCLDGQDLVKEWRNKIHAKNRHSWSRFGIL